MNSPAKNNYFAAMQQQLERIDCKRKSGIKQSLLLHACCAPCSSQVIELLASHFSQLHIRYYNPNIYPYSEYTRRLEELRKFLNEFPPAENIILEEAEYNQEEYFLATGTRDDSTLQNEAERGERCRRCYRFRMEESFRFASQHQFDYITTTLSISPHKDAQAINRIGEELEQQFRKQYPQSAPSYLFADFKKKEGFKRSLEISAEYGLYRQDYCGCIYSMRRNKQLTDNQQNT